MTKDLFAALRDRRSIYGISAESPISDEEIQNIIEETVKHTPSAFNSQSTRVVLLLGKQHERLWDITTDVLKAVVPADQFASTQQKMDSFRQGHGTVLFFEDLAVIGMNSTILAGARIGSGSLIGAGSLVKGGMTIPAGTLAAGNPATVKKAISGDSAWWIENAWKDYYHLSRQYLQTVIIE
ncbi:MAG: nitroreductase family protein [Alicyclobacillus shizuokensis]|nr:nitroreductase family protein [Alicyclobacillus shizuokensis]